MDSLAKKESDIPGKTEIQDIKLQETSLDIWEGKYCLKSKEGIQIDKGIEDTYKRVARSLANVEAKDELIGKIEEKIKTTENPDGTLAPETPEIKAKTADLDLKRDTDIGMSDLKKP